MIRPLVASSAALLFASSLAFGAVPRADAPPAPARIQKEAAAQMPTRLRAGSPEPPAHFRASHLRPVDVARLPAQEKQSAAAVDERGRLRIASVRALPKAAAVPGWASIPDGFVSTLRATSDGARGLRVRLDLGPRAAPVEIRAQGTDGRVESMVVEPSRAEAWTPWTEGASQVIELFSPSGAPLPSASVASVLHFDASPFEKAASSCTVSAACSTGDSILDNAIAERVKSSVRITFVEGSSGFLCSATLLNTEHYPTGYLLTANHCVSTAASAGSVSTFWFYEPVSCPDTSLQVGMVQLSGGTSLTFTNYNADATLLRMSQSPPPGAAYSGWDAARVPSGTSVQSISHPRGDTTRLATGGITNEYRINDRAQDEYGVAFNRGIIEGGSSGSGLFTLSGNSLLLRGILTGTTVRNSGGLSCTNLDEEALYGRFEILYPQMLPYVTGNGAPFPDDAPNRVIDFAGVPLDTALNGRSVSLDRRIDVAGDVDVYRFSLSASASVTLGTQGSMDTIGTLMDANGKAIVANDDVAQGNLNFGITRTLQAGTYFVMVAHWEPYGAGPYRLQMSASAPLVSAEVNFTDLWWSAESGWGINLAHQGDIVFALLYTYDLNGSPMWLFMSNGDKQSDGSFSGPLHRANGPVYTAPGWSPINTTVVGSMRVNFTGTDTASLVYTVNGISVTKTIRRFQFATPPTTCTFTQGDRTTSTNYQDLWWNPAESGWGISIAHQGNTLFALLYVYDSNGQPLWFSMSNGTLGGPGTYSGALYRSVGPPFNTTPWSATSTSSVGSMTIAFTDGENGTLTYTVDGAQVVKQIRRTVYSNPKPLCTASS